MELTPKKRILNAICGKEVDRTPWSPFLAYYWDFIPESEKNRGQLDYLKKMGADPLLRGFNSCYRVIFNNCDISQKRVGDKLYKTYETKVGSITEVHSKSQIAQTWFRTEHPVKTEEDFKVLQYIFENLIIEERISNFDMQNKQLGDEGLYLPLIGVGSKTAFQALVEHWCGTVDLVYALEDFPETVEECLSVMQDKDWETVKVSVKSSADGFIFWEDSSTTNICPSLFSKYTAPEIDQWGKLIHNNGKLLIHHACGHLKDLIPLMCETEIDMIESMSPPPTGNIDINDATKLMPEHIGIIGGLEPTFLQDCTLEQLENRVLELLEVMKGKRYVLANSDSCPPNVEYEKFLLVSEIVKRTVK